MMERLSRHAVPAWPPTPKATHLAHRGLPGDGPNPVVHSAGRGYAGSKPPKVEKVSAHTAPKARSSRPLPRGQLRYCSDVAAGATLLY